MKTRNILNQSVSFFRNAFATKHPQQVDLWTYLQGSQDNRPFQVPDWCFGQNRIPAKYYGDFQKARGRPLKQLVKGFQQRTSQKGKTDKLQEFKKLFPAIAVSGQFIRRANDALIQHSGLIALDFDNVDDMKTIRSEIEALDFVAYVGLSISGTGFYVIIPIPKHEDNQGHHQSYFALEKYFWDNFQLKTDKSCKDVARLRFYSVDKKPFFNPEALIFNELLERSIFEDTSKPHPNSSEISYKILSKIPHEIEDNLVAKRLKRVLESVQYKISNAVDGEKNGILLTQSKLLGGYVSGGYMDYQSAFDFLEHEISKRNIKSIGKARQTIENGLKYGQNQPISIQKSIQNEYLPQKIEGKVTAKTVFLTGIRALFEHRKQLEVCILYVEYLQFLKKSEM